MEIRELIEISIKSLRENDTCNEYCILNNDLAKFKKLSIQIINNKENFAIAITKGILNYYDMTYEVETSQTTTTDKLYRVQVGAFSIRDNAIKLSNELKKKGYDNFIIEGRK